MMRHLTGAWIRAMREALPMAVMPTWGFPSLKGQVFPRVHPGYPRPGRRLKNTQVREAARRRRQAFIIQHRQNVFGKDLRFMTCAERSSYRLEAIVLFSQIEAA